MGHPRCFESQKLWDEWLDKAKASGLEDPEYNFCIDCTPQYKAKSLAENVCERPSTFFLSIATDEGESEVIGISDLEF